MKKIAAFDIGSNAVRLAIGSLSLEGELELTQRIRVPLRLGGEVFSTGILSEHTIESAVRTFKEFKKILEYENVEVFEAVATSAFRNAQNSGELGDRVLSETGIFIRGIDGKEEAALIRKALQLEVDLERKNYLLFDIGGGSAELTYLKKGVAVGSISLPMGTVRLLEIGKEAEKNGLVSHKAYQAYLKELRPSILSFFKNCNPQEPLEKPIRVVGTGGNFKRLSRLRKKVLDKRSIRYVLPHEVQVIRETLEQTPYLKRIKKFNLRPDRADVIIPALYIMDEVTSIIPTKKIITPDIGLIHGLLHQVAEGGHDSQVSL